MRGWGCRQINRDDDRKEGRPGRHFGGIGTGGRDGKVEDALAAACAPGGIPCARSRLRGIPNWAWEDRW